MKSQVVIGWVLIIIYVGQCSLFIRNRDSFAVSDNAYIMSYNDFLCANIHEDQAQWRNKTKGLSKLVIENNA